MTQYRQATFTNRTAYELSLSLSLRVNVGCGPAEERVLLTGLHAVADIYCENCKTTLGWKYVSVRVCICRRGRTMADTVSRVRADRHWRIITFISNTFITLLDHCRIETLN